MIALVKIELEKFKGLERMECTFEHVTVLAGPNNCGKTSVLQAVYLLAAAVSGNRSASHAPTRFKDVALRIGLSRPTPGTWDGTRATIRGTWSNGLVTTLSLSPDLTGTLSFQTLDKDKSEKDHAEMLKQLQFEPRWMRSVSEIITDERFLAYPQFQEMLSQGDGPRYWRNELFWSSSDEMHGAIPRTNFAYELKAFYPNVEAAFIELDKSSPTLIKLVYTESRKSTGMQKFEIASAGSGFKTMCAIALALRYGKCIFVLDEPDAHLHSSQQARLLKKLLDLAIQNNAQVLVASHSPEIISRAPSECLRWLDKDGVTARQIDRPEMLETLGSVMSASPNGKFPDTIVWVEGITDRPIVEGIVRFCLKRNKDLPTTVVIPYRAGRFGERELRAISRYLDEMHYKTRVVGIRDLDYEYSASPAALPAVTSQGNWSLVTLPCKEIENLLCDPEVLFQAYEKKISLEDIQSILAELSNASDLTEPIRLQICPRVRDRLPASMDVSTKERDSRAFVESLLVEDSMRLRLVAGKALLPRVRARLRAAAGRDCYPSQMCDRLETLPASMKALAQAIFPSIS
jgi:predicted ATPase